MKKTLFLILILISMNIYSIEKDFVIEIYDPLGNTIDVGKYNFFNGKVYKDFDMSKELGTYSFDGLLLKFNVGPSELWGWKIKNRFAGSGIIRGKTWIPITFKIKEMHID